MKKAALVIMIITGISKLLGFSREIVQSYFFGASAITDAYLISQTIPTQIFAFISAGIATSFVPVYSRILRKEGKSAANRHTTNLANFMLFLASVTAVIVFLFTGFFIKVFATGFSGVTFELAIRFTRIAVFSIYFGAILTIFGGYLRLHGNYTLPALAGLSFNLVLIPSLVLGAKINIYILAVGGVLASAVQLLILLPAMRRSGYRYEPTLDLGDKYLKQMIMLAIPLILSRSVSRINVLVDRTLASAIAIGGISALNYADRLGGFIQGLFVDSITTVLYPNISKMVADNDMRGLKSTISEALGIINLLVIPAMAGSVIFSKEIVCLLFGRGAFTAQAIEMTAQAMLYYSVGMIALGRTIMYRAFYALEDTKKPTINATIAVLINIVLNIILSRYLGIGGLALATSISGIVSALLIFISLRKKIGPFGLMEITRSFVKISIASVIMGGFAYGSFRLMLLRLSQNLSLIFAIGIGALTYAIIIYFMKIPEVDNTLAALKKKLAGRINSKKDTEPQP